MDEIAVINSQRHKRMTLPGNARNDTRMRLPRSARNDTRMKIPLKNLMKGQTRHQGFTLVEFLVSFTLVTLLITGTAQITIHTLFIKRNADLNMKTAELASSFLEYLKSLPYESDVLKVGSREKPIKEDGSLETFIRQWNVTDIAQNLKRIEDECFSKNRRFKKTRLVLYVSKELGF